MSDDAVELDCPLKHPDNFVGIVGSCNGLICVTNVQDILYIWNPATRPLDRLPHCGVKLRTSWNFMYSFGYLESNDDYKVVGTGPIPKHGGGYSSEAIVYSMKTENWKRIGEFPNGFSLLPSGKYLNGALHWVANHDFCSWRIVSLGLAKETYYEVPQPVYGKNGFVLSLGVLGDRLTVMRNYDDGLQWDVWVMKEYGVKESWTKLVSIPYVTDPARINISETFGIWKPMLKFISMLRAWLLLLPLPGEMITRNDNRHCFPNVEDVCPVTNLMKQNK